MPQGIPKALDESQVELLLGAVTGDGPLPQRDRALLETLYATGSASARRSAWSSAISISKTAWCARAKGDKERIVPIGRSAALGAPTSATAG